MARDEHNKAAEHHENAAKSHRNAAEHHGKGDHAKGKEHSTNAQQHSRTLANIAKKPTPRANNRSELERPDLRRAFFLLRSNGPHVHVGGPERIKSWGKGRSAPATSLQGVRQFAGYDEAAQAAWSDVCHNG